MSQLKTLLLVFMLGAFLRSYAQSYDSTIIVSDFDNTLKKTQGKHIVSTLYRLWFKTDAYDSVGAMYRGMKSEGAKLYFVTNQPRLFYRNSYRLLKEQGFESDTFIYRPFFKKGEKHKKETISKIIEQHKGYGVLMLGDDYSKDPLIYESLYADYGPAVYHYYIFGRIGWETRILDIMEIQRTEALFGKSFDFEFLPDSD